MGGFLGQLEPEFLWLLPMLDERSRRLAMGMAAAAAGEGGTRGPRAGPGVVADGGGREGRAGVGRDLPAGRVRRAGGGRKKLEDADPGLPAALDALIRDAIRETLCRRCCGPPGAWGACRAS